VDIPPPPPPPPSPDGTPPPKPPAPGPYDPAPPYSGNPYGGDSPYGRGNTYSGGGSPYSENPYGGASPYGGSGPYGPQPYPGPPRPAGVWYPPPVSTNGMAIASLVTSLSCIPLLGAVFGLVGLSQIRKRGERGKGLAVAGLVINSLCTLGIALLIVLAALGVLDEDGTPIARIEVGQCFNGVGGSLTDGGGDTHPTSVRIVECAEEHDAEAFAVFAIVAPDDGGYPGVERISAIAESKCASLADDYAAGVPWENSAAVDHFMPSSDGWRHGHHSVICFFDALHGKATGSVKDGEHGSQFGV
jgi:hypothetical protein